MKFAFAVRLALIPAVFGLSGCAATEMAIQHHNLSVQTKMSNTIFLNPVPPSEETVYVQMRNTSDKHLVLPQLRQEVEAGLAAQGYRAVPFNKAHYLMQVNVLSVGKSTLSAAQSALGGGYGGAVAGALAGGVIGQSFEGAGAGGLAGGAIGFIADSLVHTNTYDMVTDIQIGVRSVHAVSTDSSANIRQGTSTVTRQNTQQTSHWLYYRTRMVSTATQVDLSFKEALPRLQGQLVHSLSGIL